MGVFLGNSPFYIGSGIFRIIYAHQCMKNKMKNLQPFVLYVLTGRRFIFAQSYHSLGKFLSYHTPQTFIAWKSFLLTFLVDKTSRDNNSVKIKGCKSPFQKHPRHHIPDDRDRSCAVVPLCLVELHQARATVVPQPKEDPRPQVWPIGQAKHPPLPPKKNGYI